MTAKARKMLPRRKPLKRTPLKRTGFASKPRKRIATKRKPRPMLTAYRKANPEDEIRKYLGFSMPRLPGEEPGCLLDQMPNEVNHIFSLGRRPDVLSNLITLTAHGHKWFHANLDAGRVLCLLAKSRKGELNLPELDSASGKAIVTWVETLDFGDDLRMRMSLFELRILLQALEQKSWKDAESAA